MQYSSMEAKGEGDLGDVCVDGRIMGSIKMDLRVTGYEPVDCTQMAHDPLGLQWRDLPDTVLNLRVP